MTNIVNQPKSPSKLAGQILKQARVLARMGQKEFATIFNCSQPLISRIEIGKAAPSLDLWIEFCRRASIDHLVVLNPDQTSVCELFRGLSSEQLKLALRKNDTSLVIRCTCRFRRSE